MTEPLTDQQLAAMQARCDATTDVEWSAARGGGYPFLITQGTPAADAEGDDKWDGIGLISTNLALKPAEDMAFIIAAHRDMPALFADNARLRAELAKYVGKEPTVAEEMAYVSSENDRLTTEVEKLTAELGQARTAAPLLIDRDDLTELSMILMAERYRLDKGDDTPVPQPRWGANVRISQAVNAALTNPAPACTCHAEAVHQQGCATT